MENIYSHKKKSDTTENLYEKQWAHDIKKAFRLRSVQKTQNSKASDTHITVFHNQITDNCNYVEKMT